METPRNIEWLGFFRGKNRNRIDTKQTLYLKDSLSLNDFMVRTFIRVFLFKPYPRSEFDSEFSFGLSQR